MRVKIDGSKVVWWNHSRVRSSISHYALEAGTARLARKMDTYITSKMAELPKMLERRYIGEPIQCTYMYVLVSANNSISSRGNYSRAASISFHACSGAATIQERRLFESGVYSVIYGMFWPSSSRETTV